MDAIPQTRRHQSSYRILRLNYGVCCRPDANSDPGKREMRDELNQKREERLDSIRQYGLSKKQLKKRLKHPTKNFDPNKKLRFDTCSTCANPKVSSLMPARSVMDKTSQCSTDSRKNRHCLKWLKHEEWISIFSGSTNYCFKRFSQRK